MLNDGSIDRVFLEKLTQIIDRNLTNEQFGVKELSNEMGMSRSQIHRKLKKIYQKSISQYIREIRLKKAQNLLQQKVATVSEISYKVGFGSPTYFSKCYHDYYGYPPGEEEKKNIENKNQVFEQRKSKRFFHMYILATLGILFIVSFIYFVIPQIKGESSNKGRFMDKSIAVLPFKCLSDDSNNLYFANGMMEEILNRLSQVHELKVISRISSEQYKGSTKSLPQIAKELDVAFVLEGSIQKYENKARIFVQLIEAPKDQHIWSNKYDVSFENLLSVQSKIAKKVASEMEAVLSPEELRQIEKIQTDNLEAYNLYLKGRFFWNRRTKVDVKTSIKYFQQCIKQDSSYALAYSGLADAYFILSCWKWYPVKEGFKKAREYALKALSIDENLAEPHATLGGIAYWAEWNWEEAGREFKRAIELNENYATAHQWYAEHLSAVGKLHEAIQEINKARELDPLSMMMYNASGCYYYQVGEYEKALDFHQTALEMNEKFRYTHIDIFYIYLKQEREKEAVLELKKYLEKDTFDRKHIPSMELAFEKSGINGVLIWLIELQLEKNAPEPYFIAELYAKLGKKEKALDWLEIAFEAKVCLLLIRLKKDHNLENLHSEPRYKALLAKMRLDN